MRDERTPRDVCGEAKRCSGTLGAGQFNEFRLNRWSVKTPMHKLDIGAARSGHLISVVLALKNYFFGLHRSFE